MHFIYCFLHLSSVARTTRLTAHTAITATPRKIKQQQENANRTMKKLSESKGSDRYQHRNEFCGVTHRCLPNFRCHSHS